MMNSQKIIIGAVIITLLASSMDSTVVARDLTEKERESGFYYENGYTISSQRDRPAINPDFAPDESCL